jgi:GNAT superfamily N-acetyltransferase
MTHGPGASSVSGGTARQWLFVRPRWRRVAARYTIRAGRAEDGPGFVRLVRELAEFERLAPPDADAQKRLIEDAVGPRPRFELFVAEAAGHAGIVGYAVVLWTYSSFLAKPTLYLEDIYLTPAHRGTGLARVFLAALARHALERGAGRIEGVVLTWNERARRFYAATGAKELEDWRFFRYDERALQDIARANP